MNPPSALPVLGNRYVVMRHGESAANRLGIILSDPAAGVRGFGLTARGREQARASARATTLVDRATLIYSSDFRRAMDTAAVVREIVGCTEPVRADPALRERFFGELERGDTSLYRRVWDADRNDSAHRNDGVESADAVTARATGLILELERRHRGRRVLLVAHGDVLQLLQTAFERRPAAEHRSLPHLATAEIRALHPAV